MQGIHILILWISFIFLESLFPRKEGVFWKKTLKYDLLYVFINGWLFWKLWPSLDQLITQTFHIPQLGIKTLPLLAQWLIVMVCLDFLRWCTHYSFHHIPLFWKMHATHHRVKELHFLRVLVFNPLENVVYSITTLLPLVFLGFNPIIWPALILFDATIGFWNHSNVRIRVPTWLAKIINTPQVHIWHHDESLPHHSRKNFGINLTLWDWLFGTLYIKERDPKKIGYEG